MEKALSFVQQFDTSSVVQLAVKLTAGSELVMKYVESDIGLTETQAIALASLFSDVPIEEIMATKFLEYLNNRNFVLAGNLFLSFNKVNRVASMAKTRRRKAEQTLFNCKEI